MNYKLAGSFLVFLLLMSISAFGQLAGGGGQQGPVSNPYPVYEHPQHADRHDMAAEQSLVGGGSITTAHGERPLWECADLKPERPLGDVAREYRKLALYGTEKARIHWEQQGK
jgi:hypothetical protein